MSKTDLSSEALISKLVEVAQQEPDAHLLWIADEHPMDTHLIAQLKIHSVRFITNRFDQYQLALKNDINAEFSDFHISAANNNPPSHIFFRIAKERPVVHQVINQAFKMLPINGNLWLAGYKNEGIKTHYDRAASLFGGRAEIKKSKNQLSLARMIKNQKIGESFLDDQNYTQLQSIEIAENQNFWTKPGLYGWNKIDLGSQLLITTLKEYIEQDREAQSILDIGCGYGYLSCFAAGLQPKKLVATDNCFAAIEATKANLKEFDFASVIASDAADNVSGEFDLILCNPPFHQGFSTTDALHSKFLINTKRLLKREGQAWYVVNQFLPLENYCDQIDLNWSEVTRNKGFKVIKINR